MKTQILSTCLALTLQLVLGNGCGISIHPIGDDAMDRPDSGSGDSDGGSPADGGSAADGSIADGGTHDAGAPGGTDAGLADASPEADASIDAGVQDHPVQVQAGQIHTCALAANGTVRCWGGNSQGQLGESTIIPHRTTPTEVAGLAGVTQIALGSQHTCALMSNGTVKCWGDNQAGQCGTGSTSDFLASPTTVVSLSGVLEIAAGSDHTCARVADGSAYCFGLNTNGQLGDGTTTDRPRPTRVPNVAGVTDIAVGRNHTCIVDAFGGARCWGGNHLGQVLPGALDEQPYPVPVPLPSALSASVTLGYFHTCARMTDRTAQCWGSNQYGQLGGGGENFPHQHAQVAGLTTAVEIASGSLHSCARLEDGGVRCWGANYLGQLGDGTLQDRSVPQPLGNITDATGITASFGHGCAVEAGGAMLCWGDNTAGQLGDGTTTRRLVPTPVLW